MNGVPRETRQRLQRFVALLIEWNKSIRLVARADQQELWSRHVDDCLSLLSMLPATARTLVDVGSGAGFPGLVLAIARPDLAITLVEADRRKAAFLAEAARVSGTNVRVVAARIEQARLAADVVTARAVAPLTDLLGLTRPLLNAGAVGLFMKGSAAAHELGRARTQWTVDMQLIPYAGGAIIRVIGPLAEHRSRGEP
jgi:16S rRNA (guanine527-N7)-methyltransferase